VVGKHILWNALKYVLAFGLLGYVIWDNWKDRTAEQSRECLAAFAVSPQASFPGNLPWTQLYLSTQRKPPGLAHVWQKHAIRGEPIRTGFLAMAFLVAVPSVLLTMVRWYFLVRAQDLPFSLANALRLGMVGFFFNNFLPGSVSGDVVKAAFIARQQSRRTIAVATVIMDRAIALCSLVWFVALVGGGFWVVGLLSGQIEKSIVLTALGISAASLAVWMLLGFLPTHRAERFAGRLTRLPRVGHSAAEFWRAVWMYRTRPASIGLAMAISFLGFIGFVLLFYFSACTLWDPNDPAQKIPTWWQHFLIVPIGVVIQAIPLFPGGAGIGEWGFGELYRWLGCSVASGVLGSLVQRVIYWVLGLVCYVVYLRMRPAIRKATDAPAELAVADA
jgi:uncharacterized protein (TIRG00374 family)